MGTVEAGTVVGGKYRLDAPIGEGGMASVWRATHTTLESAVAVKFLDLAGAIGREELKGRFLREAKLAANLKHRNVVHTLDFGVLDPGDQPFMVMELLEGQSLGDRFTGADDLDEVAMMDVFAELLGGLAAVHDAGIVHRDIKPDNVFLVRDADGEYPKLLDFGVSRSRGSARLTAANTVVGTPAYMSPEQALAEADLDERSDLFSVGLMLYEFFTGFLPFETDSPTEVMIRIATQDMPPLAEHRPDLPDEVLHLVDTAVKRDRVDRFEDARAMRDALLGALDALSTAPRRGSPTQRRRAAAQAPTVVTANAVEAPSSSRRWILGGVAAVAVLLGAGLASQWAAGGPDASDVGAPSGTPQPELSSAGEPQARVEPEPGVEPSTAEPSTAEPSTAEPPAEPSAVAPSAEPTAAEPDPTEPAPTPAREAVPEPSPPDPPQASPVAEAEPEPPRAERSRPAAAARPQPPRAPSTPVTPEPPPEPSGDPDYLRDLDY